MDTLVRVDGYGIAYVAHVGNTCGWQWLENPDGSVRTWLTEAEAHAAREARSDGRPWYVMEFGREWMWLDGEWQEV